ncbi:hypothetical protein Tco_0273618 [Tanacetum coccineum]
MANIEKWYFHEGKVVSPNFDNMSHIWAKFKSIGFDCLLDINEQIVHRFVLQFYCQLTFTYNHEGQFVVNFVIQNKSFSLTLEEFGQILKILFKGQDSNTEMLPLDHLLFKHVMSVSPELAFDHYLSHDRAMHPLAPHYERKTRADRGTKRPRESNASSSSTTQNHPSSSHPLDHMLRESSFQNIQPRRFLRLGSQSNVGFKKSCQSSEYGSDLDQITSSDTGLLGMDQLSKRKFGIVCHGKVIRILLEDDEILRVHGERTQGVVQTLMNTKIEEEHEVHLKLELELLRNEKLYAKVARVKQRVRAISMTIQSSVKDKILATSSETSKVENTPAEMLRDLDQQIEKRADDDLVDDAESVSDAMRSEYCLASSSRWTKSLVLWAEIGESSLIGPELVQETTD